MQSRFSNNNKYTYTPVNKLCWFTEADCWGQIPCCINKSTGSTPKLLHWCALIFLPLHTSQLAFSVPPVHRYQSQILSFFPLLLYSPSLPPKRLFFPLSSLQKYTHGNGSIWKMVFVAGVVTLSVGVLMVVANLKGRIQVTIYFIVPCFTKPWLFNTSKKIYTLCYKHNTESLGQSNMES